MKRISKGFLDAAWAFSALVLAGCASAPAPVPVPPAETVPETAPAAPAEPAPAAPETRREEPLVLKEDHPARHVVQPGDTLWDLATRYLRDPWRWPELWQKNQQVKNPHLIYVGDILTLIYVDGRPMLQVQRAPRPDGAEGPVGRPYPTVKLSPQIRVQDLDKAIPTIPRDAIEAFLSRPRIVTEEELANAPYIFSSVDEHLVAGASNRVYVRGLKEAETSEFVVVRKGRTYVNLDDKDDVLGIEAIHVGNAKLMRLGDPATFDLLSTNREVLTGDRLLPADDGIMEQNFMPHAPARFTDGSIIAVQGGVTQIGQFQVVVIDRGTNAGLDVGSVMAVYSASARARDTIANETVRLPRERAGTLMIFRTFERLSYGLIMDATRPIHVYDAVTSP